MQSIGLLLFNTCLFLINSDAASLINSNSNRANQNRNVIQFGSLIWGHAGNPLDYNGYGCWCGTGNRGDLVVDATDRCCQTHDNCWGEVEKHRSGCKPLWRWYDYVNGVDKEIQCTDPEDTCDYDTCLCDKAAVECFTRHRNTSYDPDFDNWVGNCNTTLKSPKDDPNRCPPVWRSNTSYPGGSSVSVNGIVYRAFYWADPGKNPKRYSSTWQGSGMTWQKLKPCRRTNDGSLIDEKLDS